MSVQKNRLTETVLLSTHNICFGWEIRKSIFWYALLTKGLFTRLHKLNDVEIYCPIQVVLYMML